MAMALRFRLRHTDTFSGIDWETNFGDEDSVIQPDIYLTSWRVGRIMYKDSAGCDPGIEAVRKNIPLSTSFLPSIASRMRILEGFSCALNMYLHREEYKGY